MNSRRFAVVRQDQSGLRPDPWVDQVLHHAHAWRSVWGPYLVVLAAAACASGKEGAPSASEAGEAGPAAVDLEVTAGAPPTSDGEDNDCDGTVDEPDERERRRLWRYDADHDGAQAGTPQADCTRQPSYVPFTDLADPLDCDDTDPTVRPGLPEDCLRRGDEDCNGTQDCADLACADQPCAEHCADHSDNDADGLDDCLDPDCWGPDCAEDCATPGDEDANGLADCEDAACAAWCVEVCDNGEDDDEDGYTDCEDFDCALSAACPAMPILFPEGGAQLVMRSERSTHGATYSRRYEATLLLHSVRVEQPTSAGAEVCSTLLPTLTVSAMHHVRRDSTTRSPSWSGSHWLQPVAAPIGSPGCPAPTTSALSTLALQVVALPWWARWDPTRPLIPIDLDLILFSGAFDRYWAPTGLDIGPHRTRSRTEWGSAISRHSEGSQTATIDSLVPLE